MTISKREPLTIDELILTLAGQGMTKESVCQIVKKELATSGTISLWTPAEIEREVNLVY